MRLEFRPRGREAARPLRKNGFSVYLTGIPWSSDFMAQYAAALQGVEQATNIGANRTAAGTAIALVAAYLDPLSTSPFKTGAAETQRARHTGVLWSSISARPRAPMKPTSKFRYIPNCAMG